MPNIYFLWFLTLYWPNAANPMALLENPTISIGDSLDSDIIQILSKKDYFPKEDYLPKSPVMKNIENDATYILSKLSDDVLLKLLNQQPKQKEYYINDVLNIIGNSNEANKLPLKEIPTKYPPQGAVFRLENKEVQPYNYNSDRDPTSNAVKKLNNILFSRPQEQNSEEDKQKEFLFNVLVAQLKSLCCKKYKPKTVKSTNFQHLKYFLNKNLSLKPFKKPLSDYQLINKSKEQLFLIINDEIKSNLTEDLIAVDPDTLSKNSSVLLLGPITTPLSDIQLKIVMNRVGNELSKPEYLPLLQRISQGVLDDNIGITNSLLSGPESRRYIKPHRCNHQSKLAKIYGGPKWLICTGYLNLNTPSVYD